MVKNKFHIVLVVVLFITVSFSDIYAIGLKYYLVQLKDKNNSGYTINQPQSFLSPRALNRRNKQNIAIQMDDIPVSSYYTDSLQKLGLTVWSKSKWLNAVVIYTDITTISKVNSLSFVLGYQPLSRIENTTPCYSNLNAIKQPDASLPLNYGNSSSQNTMIGIDKMHEDGFAGQEMQIAVLDAGFNNANQLSVFDSLFINNRILATYDYVKKETSVYEDHSHGTEVLSVLAGYSEGNLIGGAYRSSFYLLRTEDGDSESLLEEFNWAVAAEFADSAGVDVIASSLGYTDFDNTALSHQYIDFNGKTTIAAKAAKAAARKGILVCVSAGNYGANAWKYISTPADTDSIITVGSVDSQGKYAYFSSIGPSADGRIKPDLVTKGLGAWVATTTGSYASSNGTSFSCPILCGLAAGYWSEFPNLTNQEVIANLKKSASQYINPDNYLGYGIPNYVTAKNMVLALEKNMDDKPFMIFPNPALTNLPLVIRMLDTSKIIQISVYKADGEIVEVVEIERLAQDVFLNITHLTQGVYFLKVMTSNQSHTQQFVKF